MSKPSAPTPKPRTSSPDGATPVGDMILNGVVKTTKGWALATVTLALDGSLKVSLGVSQAYKEHISTQLKRATLAQALRA